MQSRDPEFQRRFFEIGYFIIIFGGLAFILTTVPLLPLGLPVVISFLIAFGALKNPKRGITLGSFLVGLSLIYHMARLNFIYILSNDPEIRFLFVFAFLLLFFIIPSSVESRHDAIPVIIGMTAAGFLLFEQSFFLSVPLILIFATIYKKARLGLALSYYVLISIPLQMLQYVTSGTPTSRPPLYVPLTSIFGKLQEAMSSFTFEEIFNVLLKIVNQITGNLAPNAIKNPDSMMLMLGNYLNSAPGMIVFFLILSGLISVAAFATSYLINVTKNIEMIREYTKFVNMFLPLITAVCVNILFWVISDSLQVPLGFKAEVTATNEMLSTLGTIGIMIPVSVTDYWLKRREIIKSRSLLLIEKVRTSLKNMEELERVINRAKFTTPIIVTSVEAQLSLIKDELNNIINKASLGFYSPSELDELIQKIQKNTFDQLINLSSKINALLDEYYARTVHQFSLSIEKLREIGLNVDSNVETIDIRTFGKKDINEKIDIIRKLLEDGRNTAKDSLRVYEKIYETTRSLYDPRLPEDSPTAIFVRQKIEEATPWVAMEAICTSLYNLERQYGNEISASIRRLSSSLTSIIELDALSDRLSRVLGGSLKEILDHVEKIENIKARLETEEFNVMKVIIIEDVLESALRVSKELLEIFYNELQKKEMLIDSLVPVRDYGWGRNSSLVSRISDAIEVLSNPSKYEVKKMTNVLFRSFAYFDECLQTLETYIQKYELFLNYPVAETVMDRFIEQKGWFYVKELPFEPKYSEEYARMYYRKKYRELIFDESNKMVAKRE